MTAETFGERLRRLREGRGISQGKAAREMGLRQNMLSRYEHDVSVPDSFFLGVVATYYGVTMDYLWLGKDVVHCKDCANNSADDYPSDKSTRPKPAYCRKQCRWRPDDGFCDEGAPRSSS